MSPFWQNPPSTHSDNETKNIVAELPNNDAQAEVKGQKMAEGYLGSHEKDQKSNKKSSEDVKPNELDESEPYQSTEEKFLQHTSTEGTVPTEIELKTSESTERNVDQVKYQHPMTSFSTRGIYYKSITTRHNLN